MNTTIAQKLTGFAALNYDTVVSKLKLVLEVSDASFYFSHSAVIQDGQLLLSVEGHLCYEKEEAKELVSEFFYQPGELTLNEARLEVLKSMFLLTVGQESIEPAPEEEQEEQKVEDSSYEDSSLNEEEQGVSEAEALSNEETSSSLFDDEAPSETIAEATEEEADGEVQQSELEPEPKAESEQSQAPVENTVATISEEEAWESLRFRGLNAAKEKGASDSLLFEWETMPAKAAVAEIKEWIISQQEAASA